MRQFYNEIFNIIKDRKAVVDSFGRIAEVVGSTMGPGGHTVAMNEPGRAFSTKDGANILKIMSFEDKYDDFAAKVLRDITQKTVGEVGDGTTLTTVLTSELMKLVMDGSGDIVYSRLDSVRRELEKVVEKVKGMAIEIDLGDSFGRSLLEGVSTISANNNGHYGRLVSEIVGKVGKNGYISVYGSGSDKDYVEHKEGYVLGGGMLHPAFMRGEKKVELKNCYGVVVDQELDDYDSDIRHLKDGLISLHHETGKKNPLVLFVKDLKGTALQSLIGNLGFPVYPVRIPDSINKRGDRYELVKDLQAAVGAKKLYSTVEGFDIKQFQNEEFPERDFGLIDKIIITPTEASIDYSGNKEVKKAIQARIEEIDKRLEDEPGDEMLKSRKAILESGIGIIFVSVPSEGESEYVKDLLDDSIKASFAALKHGVVAGGGQTLLRVLHENGFSVLSNVLRVPFLTVMDNAGYSEKEGEKIIKRLVEGEFNDVFDIKAGDFFDFKDSSVWDPVDVLVHSLRNAMSAVMVGSSKYMIHFKMNENYDRPG